MRLKITAKLVNGVLKREQLVREAHAPEIRARYNSRACQW